MIGSLAHPSPALAALTDEEVAARVVAGDAPLFEILMRRHNQRLYRVARAILGDDAEAEDVMQEAYVRAYHELTARPADRGTDSAVSSSLDTARKSPRLGRFRGEARFATWLTKIAAHEALARLKKRRRLAAVPLPSGGDGEGPPEPASTGADPERETGNRELAAALHEAVESLSEPLRAVFVLRDVEGLSTEETAETLGITQENAKVRLHRARTALRGRLDERIGREVRRLYLFEAPRCDRLVAAVFARLDVG